MNNPLLSDFKTPYGVPPFDKIKEQHFIPATLEAIKIHEQEIQAITNNTEEPDFENTILALEKSGALLTRVRNVFSNINSSLTNDEIQRIAKELAPLVSAHKDAIKLNEGLFKRVKSVYLKRDELELDSESMRLLEETYSSFVRSGADLNNVNKEILKEINKKLSVLTLQFGQNVLADVNDFKLVIDDRKDLAGLPESKIKAAEITAQENGLEGKWVFTVQKPSLIPFITYAENRDLREKLFKAYINPGNNNNQNDNKEIIKEITHLRAERADLLGYESHADYILSRNMAKNPDTVYEFLHKIWRPSLKRASEEKAELQQMILDEGNSFELMPWDWWYYSNKLRNQKYSYSEEEVSQYFKLDNVVKGAFSVATKLYGISFNELTSVPVYHKDVKAFEVLDKDSSLLGILYMDFFPRASKRSGAWMSNYREQYIENGKDIRPIVTTNFNFTKPVGDKPALLSLDEALTTFHEFGHALHSLLSKCTYESISGTNVRRDFVELPSQIMEHWALEPEVLKTYAFHYKTGEIIPESLVNKVLKSSHFNKGFETTEYLAASFLDMDYHTIAINDTIKNVLNFEKHSMDNIGLIPEIIVRYRSTYFKHIFSGGYSAGYYSYIWAERLDSDAFDAFKETGDIFNPEVAKAFRLNILEKGNTEDPDVLYENFRGKQPGVKSLLKNRGLYTE